MTARLKARRASKVGRGKGGKVGVYDFHLQEFFPGQSLGQWVQFQVSQITRGQRVGNECLGIVLRNVPSIWALQMLNIGI